MKRRLLQLVSCTFAALLISTSASALTFVVDSTIDSVDISPGDGICLTDESVCTLRAAIMEANASAGADIIDLTAISDPASPIILTLEGVDETFVDANGGDVPCVAEIVADASIGDLDITEDLEIIGAGPALTIIEWENQSIDDPNVGDRIFHIQAEPETTISMVRISDLMIRRGSVGIPNTTDVENVYNCDVSGEPGSIVAWQFKRVGGGIAAGPGAAVFLFEEETAAHFSPQPR
jgi:CSLREA domain-containing protein